MEPVAAFSRSTLCDSEAGTHPYFWLYPCLIIHPPRGSVFLHAIHVYVYFLFIGRTDAEAEAPILRLPAVKNWLIGKDPDAGKDWRQEEKGTTEDEMVGWSHWLNGHEFEQAPGDGEGQEHLVGCSPWGHKESDMTERLNNIPIQLFGFWTQA